MGNATEETQRRATGPTTYVFTWGGTATTAATLASYAPAYATGAVVLGQVVLTNGKAYGCVKAGTSATAPTGTGANIDTGDGCRWCYLGGNNCQAIEVSNLDATTPVYIGTSSGITALATVGTVGAPVPPGFGSWRWAGGSADLIYVLGSTKFAVSVSV